MLATALSVCQHLFGPFSCCRFSRLQCISFRHLAFYRIIRNFNISYVVGIKPFVDLICILLEVGGFFDELLCIVLECLQISLFFKFLTELGYLSLNKLCDSFWS